MKLLAFKIRVMISLLKSRDFIVCFVKDKEACYRLTSGSVLLRQAPKDLNLIHQNELQLKSIKSKLGIS